MGVVPVVVANRFFGLLALVAVVVTVAVAGAFVTRRVPALAAEFALPFAAAVATVATLGSLYYSEAAGYLPDDRAERADVCCVWQPRRSASALRVRIASQVQPGRAGWRRAKLSQWAPREAAGSSPSAALCGLRKRLAAFPRRSKAGCPPCSLGAGRPDQRLSPPSQNARRFRASSAQPGRRPPPGTWPRQCSWRSGHDTAARRPPSARRRMRAARTFASATPACCAYDPGCRSAEHDANRHIVPPVGVGVVRVHQTRPAGQGKFLPDLEERVCVAGASRHVGSVAPRSRPAFSRYAWMLVLPSQRQRVPVADERLTRVRAQKGPPGPRTRRKFSSKERSKKRRVEAVPEQFSDIHALVARRG